MNYLIIDYLESLLQLTADEKATLEACFPAIDLDANDLLSAWPDITQLNNWLVVNAPLTVPVLADGGTLMAGAAALLSENGSPDLVGMASAVADINKHLKANPAAVASIQSIYGKLLPVIEKVIADWPKIQLAVQIIVAGIGRMNAETLSKRVMHLSLPDGW